MKLHLSLFRDFWKLISKLKNSDKQEKESNLNFKGKIENHVPRDHSLSSLGKSCDAKRWSSGQIFLSYPHTHDRFLYY